MVNTGVLFCAEAGHTLGDYHVLTHFKKRGRPQTEKQLQPTLLRYNPTAQTKKKYILPFFLSRNHLTKRGKVNRVGYRFSKKTFQYL